MTRRTVRKAVRRTVGFTLIELLLVLVILSVLAAIVVPKFTGRTEESKIKATQSSMSNIKTALDTYEQDNGHYPAALEDLVNKPSDAGDGWHHILDEVPKDSWSQPFQYKFPGTHNQGSYDLWSTGTDMRDGGNDDVTNWTN